MSQKCKPQKHWTGKEKKSLFLTSFIFQKPRDMFRLALSEKALVSRNDATHDDEGGEKYTVLSHGNIVQLSLTHWKN